MCEQSSGEGNPDTQIHQAPISEMDSECDSGHVGLLCNGAWKPGGCLGSRGVQVRHCAVVGHPDNLVVANTHSRDCPKCLIPDPSPSWPVEVFAWVSVSGEIRRRQMGNRWLVMGVKDRGTGLG